MTTYLRQHGLMSFISLNISEREINLHFVNSAGLQQNAPFCVLLKKKIFSWFYHTIFKFRLHRFYIQNAAECSILRPSELEKKTLPYRLERTIIVPTRFFSLRLICFHFNQMGATCVKSLCGRRAGKKAMS
jgi:hypothetical protein